MALIITDIEMPQMDGHRLTKLVKDSPRFKNIPLIILEVVDRFRRQEILACFLVIPVIFSGIPDLIAQTPSR